jgi:hypothetical protein
MHASCRSQCCMSAPGQHDFSPTSLPFVHPLTCCTSRPPPRAAMHRPSVQILVPLAESSAARLSHAAAAKQGIAAGIAGLLEPGSGIEPGGPSFKAALKALEALAVSDQDPRARRGSAGVLAELCCRFKSSQAARWAAGGCQAPGASVPCRRQSGLGEGSKLLGAPLNVPCLEPRVGCSWSARGKALHPRTPLLQLLTWISLASSIVAV